MTPGVQGRPPGGGSQVPPELLLVVNEVLVVNELLVVNEVLVVVAMTLDPVVNRELEVVVKLAPELEVVEPAPLPTALHPVGVPNASVSPHARGRQSCEMVCALPMHVSRAWKSPPRPAAVAVAWSDPHVEAQEPPAGAHAPSGHPAVPGGAPKAHAVAHVCTSWPHPVAMAMATAGVVTRSTSGKGKMAHAASWTGSLPAGRPAWGGSIRGCVARHDERTVAARLAPRAVLDRRVARVARGDVSGSRVP